MTHRPDEVPAAGGASVSPGASDDRLTPLPGEAGIPSVTQPARNALSWKGILAVALLVASLIVVSALSIQRAVGGKKDFDESTRTASRPAAAAADTRRLDLTPQPTPKPAPPVPVIPAIVPTAEERAEPIGVRRTGQPSGTGARANAVSPEDAPVLLLSSRSGGLGLALDSSSRSGQSGAALPPVAGGTDLPPSSLEGTKRNLDAYQQQLQKLMTSLTQAADLSAGRSTSSPSPAGGGSAATSSGVANALSGVAGAVAGGGLFGGQLQGSSTPRVSAAMLGNRSLTLPKGTAFTCALKTKVISAASGFVGCQVQRNVYSDDGRVLLVERGSHLDGEYRVASVRPGTVRIPVLWTRIRTPHGVTVDVESPGSGGLGESGIDGYVDNRWAERIGAAMLLSLIDDSVKLLVQNQGDGSPSGTIVLPSTTDNTATLAEKVLDSTINIPPLIYQNQGGIVGIYVARDVDFSSVYELQAVAREEPK